MDRQSYSFPPIDGFVDRRRYLPERATGKRVLHLGCVDEGLTAERTGTGMLLHEELDSVTAELTGVDVSVDGLALMESVLPGRYVHGDIEDLGSLELPDAELVIVAEVIEHLGAPAALLSGLNTYLGQTGATALITTPNAFGWRYQATGVILRREMTHPDHRLIYTPRTFVHAIELSGLQLCSLRIHRWTPRPGTKGRLLALADSLFLGLNPYLGVGLVAEVRAGQVR